MLERITLDRGSLSLPADGACRILAVIDGAVRLEGFAGPALSLAKGATALVPAACTTATLVADPAATVLSAYLP